MDAGDGKAARNGGYSGSGRSMASGGRFYGSLSWYSRGGELCVERRCSRMGGCGCLASANVLEDRGDDIGISMREMTRSLPPRLGQVSMAMAKTRFRRRIQVMGARGLSGFSWRGLRFGTTDSRCLQFGANTPWNRVRFNRGRGTNAARRAMTNRQDCRFGRPKVARRMAHMNVRHQLEWVEDDASGAVAKRLRSSLRDWLPSLRITCEKETPMSRPHASPNMRPSIQPPAQSHPVALRMADMRSGS